MRKRIYSFLLILCIFSCKKKPAEVDMPAEVKLPNKEVNALAANTHIVDSLAIQVVTSDALTINKTATSLRPKVGDILLASPSNRNPNGFLRKVISIREEGNNIICNTDFASLTEAFRQLNIDTSFTENFSSNASYRTQASLGFTFNNNTTLLNGLKINGVIKINRAPLHIEFKMPDGDEPTKIVFEAKLDTEGSNVSISNSSDNAVYILQESTLNTIFLPPFFITIPVWIPPGFIIPVQIPFMHELQFKWLPVTVTGKAKWNFSPKVTATFGAKYEGVWQSLNSFSVEGSAAPLAFSDFIPTLSMNASMTIFKPVYNIAPFNEKALKVSAELPTNLNFTLQPLTSPNYQLTLGTSLDFSIESQLWLGKKNKATFNLAEFKTTLLQGDWGPMVKISNPSNYPVLENIYGTMCAGYVISDFSCMEGDWDPVAKAPRYKDQYGADKFVNGVLLENITNTWGFNFTSCTSSSQYAVKFYNESISNGVVTGKVKTIGDFNTCSVPGIDGYFTSFNFTLINSSLTKDMQTSYQGTFERFSNTLFSRQ